MTLLPCSFGDDLKVRGNRWDAGGLIVPDDRTFRWDAGRRTELQMVLSESGTNWRR